jgi:hypothetical protein
MSDSDVGAEPAASGPSSGMPRSVICNNLYKI